MSDAELRAAGRTWSAAPDDERASADLVLALVRSGRVSWSELAPWALDLAHMLEANRRAASEPVTPCGRCGHDPLAHEGSIRCMEWIGGHSREGRCSCPGYADSPVIPDDPWDLCANCGGHPRSSHRRSPEGGANVRVRIPGDDGWATCVFGGCPCQSFAPLLRSRVRRIGRVACPRTPTGIAHSWAGWERRRLGHLGDAWVRACSACGVEEACAFGAAPGWACPACPHPYHGGDPRAPDVAPCEWSIPIDLAATERAAVPCGCAGPTGDALRAEGTHCLGCGHRRSLHDRSASGRGCSETGCLCGWADAYAPNV